jgi:hypothetical protein
MEPAVRLSARHRLVFGALFLSTGAALLVYVISGISLPAALMVSLLGALLLGVLIWRRATAPDRAGLRRTLRVGLIAGLLALAAYDLARYLLVEVAGFTFWPFDIFGIFGQALLGAGYRGPFVTLAGVAYHVANGVGFALAYTVWLGRRGIWAGIAWAMALEVVMVTIYPGWLGLKALDEFLRVSIFGHVIYGSVLGGTARQLLLRWEGARHDTPG